jgi:hypothetical protein
MSARAAGKFAVRMTQRFVGALNRDPTSGLDDVNDLGGRARS